MSPLKTFLSLPPVLPAAVVIMAARNRPAARDAADIPALADRVASWQIQNLTNAETGTGLYFHYHETIAVYGAGWILMAAVSTWYRLRSNAYVAKYFAKQ